MNTKLYALLLEDVKKDAELLQEMFSDEGFELKMDVVETEKDYVVNLKRHNYDIIFADFTLPSFNGQKALELAKEICPTIPFICISGTIGEDRAVELLKLGATDYVLKDRMERLPFATKRALEASIHLKKFRQTEIELQTNRKLLQTIINNALDSIYIKDIHGKYILINEAVEKAVGKSNAEILGKDDTSIFSASEAKMIMDIDKKVIEGGVSLTIEESLTLADKNIHVFSIIKCPMFDDYKKPTGLFGIARDITEQKNAEETIHQERILLRTLIDNLPDAIYVKDNEGRKIVANIADMQLMNCASRDEFIGKTDLEIYNNEVGAHGYEEDMLVLKTGKPMINHENCFIDTEGNQHWRLISKIPLYNEQQDIVGLVGVGHDITERKKSERQLLIAKEKAEESDRLKTAFLNNISHEIRTPMNAIIGFSGFLNDVDLTTEKREQYTKIIIQSSEHLLSVITDIINISTLEAGQEKTDETEIELNSRLKFLHEQFLSQVNNKNVSLNLMPFGLKSPVNILTDETKLIQVLSNLIGNAIKFTKQGFINFGYKIVETVEPETVETVETMHALSQQTIQTIQFFVEDSGIGVPPEMHEEIFKRFRQVESTPTRKFGGSGLGLSISKAYVELLGGKIWLNSELGKGSTFYFTIPLKKTRKNILPREQSLKDIETENKITNTLLIAEDEDSNFTLLEAFLSGSNFNIIRALNGNEAVEICKSSKHVDLVLMDIKMPIMDGYEAAIKIKEQMPNMPIIALTAYYSDADRNKAFACGCIDFISKPFKKEMLISKIGEHINKDYFKSASQGETC